MPIMFEMKDAEKDSMLQKALQNTTSETTIWIEKCMANHGAWVFATLTGLFAFKEMYMETGCAMMVLPLFIYFNANYVATVSLSYKQRMLFAVMSFFPTTVATLNVISRAPIPDINQALQGKFQSGPDVLFIALAMFLVFIAYVYSGNLHFTLVELRKRLEADRSSAELIFNEARFASFYMHCLFGMSFSILSFGLSYLFYIVLPNLPGATPHPEALLQYIVPIFVISSLAFTVFCGFKCADYSLKLCWLTVSKKEAKLLKFDA